MSRSISIDDIHAHYERNWGTNYAVGRWTAGPSWQMGPAFHVLEFPPGAGENMWTYATVGMSVVPEEGYGHGLELHLHSPTAEESHVELLAVVAHYHLTGEKLGLHHTVAFGRPWYPRSTCSYGLISLPYLFGPRLE